MFTVLVAASAAAVAQPASAESLPARPAAAKRAPARTDDESDVVVPGAYIVAAPPPDTMRVTKPPLGAGPDEVARRIDSLQVEVTVGTEHLWSGVLRVNRLLGATYNQTLRQAPEPNCPPAARGTVASRDVSIAVSKWAGVNSNPNDYQVSVSFNRSIPSAVCRPGIRSLRIEEQVRLAPGEKADIPGDAGMMVHIERLTSESP